LWLAFGNTPKISAFFSNIKNYLFRPYFIKEGKRYKFLKDFFRFLKKSKKTSLRKGQRKYFYYKAERFNPFYILSRNDFFNRFVSYNLRKNLYLYKSDNLNIFKKCLISKRTGGIQIQKDKGFKFIIQLLKKKKKKPTKTLRGITLKKQNLKKLTFIKNTKVKITVIKNLKEKKEQLYKNLKKHFTKVRLIKKNTKKIYKFKDYTKIVGQYSNNIIDTLCFFYKKFLISLIKKVHKNRDERFISQRISFYLKLFRAGYKIFTRIFNKFLEGNKP
jgi:hypothetical protein